MDSLADTCRLINSFSLQRSAGQKALYCSIAARAIKISNALSISHLPGCKCKLNNGRIWHVSFPSLSAGVFAQRVSRTFNWLLMLARAYVIESFASKVLTWCCVNAYKRFNCMPHMERLSLNWNFQMRHKRLHFLLTGNLILLAIITFQFYPPG